MPKKDFTQVAHAVFAQATGSAAAEKPRSVKQQNSAKGGAVGGPSRAAKLTAEQRAEIARVAAQARWKKT